MGTHVGRDVHRRYSSGQGEAPLRIGVHRPPQQAIEQNDEGRHHDDPQHHPGHIPLRRRIRDIGTQPVRFELRVAPGGHFRDNRGIPAAARCGDRPGDVIGENPRKDDTPPPQQPPMRKLLETSFRSPGNAAAPATTLNKMYHWVPRIISGVSQMSGLRLKVNDEQHERRKQQIGGECRQELGNRLGSPAPKRDAGPAKRRSGPR